MRTVTEPREFEHWEEAFSVCREQNRPLKIWLTDAPEVYWIYPSGRVRECKALATEFAGDGGKGET